VLQVGTLYQQFLLTDETRTYDAREGYRTIFTDIFTDVTSVTKNGEAVATTDYSIRQWDKRSASWYNSIVFTDALEADDEIAVTADWGFGGSMPKDLQLVLAQLFGLITKKNKFDATVSNKQVEDFRISFNADADLDEAFYKNYNSILKKYSMCSLPTLRQGEAHGTWV